MNNKNGSHRPLFIENEWEDKLGFKVNSVANCKKGTVFAQIGCCFINETFTIYQFYIPKIIFIRGEAYELTVI